MMGEISLGEIADVFNGKTPSKSEQRDHGHPVLKIKDVSDDGVFRGSFESFVEPSFAKRYAKKRIHTGDILILNAAHNADYVGSKQFKACSNVEGSIATGEWLIARSVDPRLSQDYLWHWFRSPSTRFEIKRRVRGIHLYPRDVAELPISLPSIEEQRRMAAILDKTDAIRRKHEQALALADKFLKSAFLEIFGDPVLNPKGYEEISLGEISDITSGLMKGRKTGANQRLRSLPYMRVANVQDGYLDLAEIKNIEATEPEINKYRILRGDLLLTEGGDPDKLGRGCVWRDEISECIHQNHIFRVRITGDVILPEVLSRQIGSRRGKSYFLRAAKQTTGIATINKRQLSDYPVLIPTKSEQREFIKLANHAEALMRKLIEEREQSEKLFVSVSQRAFRGEL